MLLYKVTLAALLVIVSSDDASNPGYGSIPTSHIKLKAQSGEERKYFKIVSHLNGFVMDVLNRDRRPGAHVIMWSEKPVRRSNQIWYHEENGWIRSQMNGLCIDIGTDGYAFMNYCHEDAPLQKWGFKHKRIQNRVNGSLILDISFYNRNLGARVATWTYHSGLNQQWYRKAADDLE